MILLLNWSFFEILTVQQFAGLYTVYRQLLSVFRTDSCQNESIKNRSEATHNFAFRTPHFALIKAGVCLEKKAFIYQRRYGAGRH